MAEKYSNLRDWKVWGISMQIASLYEARSRFLFNPTKIYAPGLKMLFIRSLAICWKHRLFALIEIC
jgi:hypothetical protein